MRQPRESKLFHLFFAGIVIFIVLMLIVMAAFTWTGHEIPCSWFDNQGPLNTPMRCWPQNR